MNFQKSGNGASFYNIYIKNNNRHILKYENSEIYSYLIVLVTYLLR
jgi:hypothetical protein